MTALRPASTHPEAGQFVFKGVMKTNTINHHAEINGCFCRQYFARDCQLSLENRRFQTLID
jgi:hypothetical protein